MPPLETDTDFEHETIELFSLQPGDLRENVVVDCDSLYELPSGTEL